MNAPMLMAVAALVTALYGVWRSVGETRAARAKAAADRAAAAAESAHSSGRLGFEERQWIMKVAHADNERLREENDELRSTFRNLEQRFESLEARWRQTEATNVRLQAHVERCEADLAALRAR